MGEARHTRGTRALRQRDGGGGTAFGGIDWEAVYGPGARVVWDEEADRTFEVHRANESSTDLIAVLEVTILPGDCEIVEFHDQATGQLVLRLEATDPAVTFQGGGLKTIVRGPTIWKLLVEEGERLWPMPPWQGLPVDVVDVTAGPEGFVAVAAVRPPSLSEDRSSLVYTWGSADGLIWEQMGSAALLDVDDIPSVLRLAAKGDRMVMVLDDTLWTSTANSDWQKVAADIGYVDATWNLSHTEFGWALASHAYLPESLPLSSCQVWISPDGVAWEPIPIAPVFEPEDGGTGGCALAGDTIVAFVTDNGAGSFWIGGFDE